jgi:two-component system chemotaxis sensor kinase CheA
VPSQYGATDDLVRVNAGAIDALIRASSSVVVAVASEAATASRLERYAHTADEALEQLHRLRRTALPYIPSGAENLVVNPVARYLEHLEDQLARMRREAHEIAATQARVSWELRQKVRDLHAHAARARMTPAETVFGSFGAMVRHLARQQGKEVDFRPEGLHVQADRPVLQQLKDPVMHLLRNAVFHGIEPPEERREAGKTPAGVVRLIIALRGDRLHVTVEDDGRGLDRDALARTAVELGMLSSAAAQSTSLQDLSQLMFQSGFSTARSATKASGRGLGLSIVKQAAIDLRGDVSILQGQGGGTAVSISVPLSISTQHIVLVAEQGYTFGIPASRIAAVRRVTIPEITRINGREAITFGSDAAPLVRLADLLDLEGGALARVAPPAVPVLVLSGGANRVAIVVERVLDDRETIVRPSGLTPSETALVAGAIALEDGTVAVVLNVSALLAKFAGDGAPSTTFIPTAAQTKTHRVLVVDDSITTRSMEKNILEAHGYEVDLAVDGVDALEKVRSKPPDLIISDVAMPGMDGFELLERLKKGKETSSIPVILVTSLEARAEQERGLTLGADAYIVKRKFDQQELLEAVKQML